MISGIVAMDEHGLIGSQGVMPWQLPEEMAWFKSKTMGHILVMGRLTYEHLPKKLEGRKVIVITHQVIPLFDGDICCDNVVELLKRLAVGTEEIMVCGGASIYQQAMPYINHLYVSMIPGEYQGDTYFPPLDQALQVVETIDHGSFQVIRYER